MLARPYDALVLDVDGTLVSEDGRIRPRVAAAVRGVRERGVAVMLATGRSESGAAPVLEELGIDVPSVVYNGAALWCPVERRLLEERLLSDRTVARVLAFAERGGHPTIVMRHSEKSATPPRDAVERRALLGLTELAEVERERLPSERVIRITLFSGAHPHSAAFAEELAAAVDQPLFLTDFPLNALAQHRDSPLQVVDVQPPCRGKAEALRWLAEERGVDPARVVAVGDASNDVELLAAAGLGVAMGNSMPEAAAAARRVIGTCETDALADLVAELWD